MDRYPSSLYDPEIILPKPVPVTEITEAQRLAMDNQNNPSQDNPFATTDDLMAILPRSMTYAELAAAIAAGTLNKGESITISDYQTVHTIPNTSDTNMGEIEPLFVTAISNNELKPEAYSVAHPDDVIYYCPENDQTMVPGCTKGYIYRRVDTAQNNDFPFDFRQVKFRRWQIDVQNWDNATEYSKMSVVKRPTGTTQQQLEVYISLVDSNTNHDVTDSAYWRRFEFDNLSYISPTEESWDRSDEYDFVITCSELYEDYHFFATGDYSSCHSNKLESPKNNLIAYSNTVVFGANFNYNSIGANSYANSIGANFHSNNIGANSNNNSIGAGFTSNSIGAGFSSNSTGANFKFNSIDANFNHNSIGDSFYSNSIGDSFYSNNIGTAFNSNSIGANFVLNSIGANFGPNSIGAGFTSNTFGNNNNNNTFGNGNSNNNFGNIILRLNNFNHDIGGSGIDYSTATHLTANYQCDIYLRADGTPRLRYCNNSDVEVIVAVNS